MDKPLRRVCPVCKAKFYPSMPRQVYDRPACKVAAFKRRNPGYYKKGRPGGEGQTQDQQAEVDAAIEATRR